MADQRSPFEGGRYHYVRLGGPDPHAGDEDPGDSPEQVELGGEQPQSQSQPQASVPPPWQTAPGAPGAPRSEVGTPPRASRIGDRVVGILLGLVLGVGIVTAFVFLGSEDMIDAPRINKEVQSERGAPGR